MSLSNQDLSPVASGPNAYDVVPLPMPLDPSRESHREDLYKKGERTPGPLTGVRREWGTAEDKRAWKQLMADLLYPHTRIGSEWTDAVWKLYEESGYFRLSGKEPHHFLRMLAPYTELHRRLDEHPGLGYRVVWPSGRGVEGTAAALHVYQGTWLGHQLGKRPGPSPDGASSRDILREVILGTYGPLWGDPDFHWLLAYCEAGVRWMQGSHFDFARLHEATDQACALPFHLLEGRTQGRWVSRLPAEGFTAEAPTPGERHRLLSVIAKTRPLCYREALDLVEERFDLARLGRTWRRAGLTREREVMVARYAGHTVAAAILERATPGTNLFHLLDGVRMFYLEPASDPTLREAAFAYLLGRAATWYRARGNECFIYYLEHDDRTHAAGMTELGEGRIWIMARQLLPDWIEHIFRMTSP